MDPVADLKGKEIKRATLNEVVDYITAGRGVLTEAVYPEIIRMVNIIFLSLLFYIFDELREAIKKIKSTNKEKLLISLDPLPPHPN